LANRVLVRRAEQISKTTSGIYFPESAQSKPNEAEVIAVGPGAKNAEGNTIAMSVKPGDKVLLPEYGGTEVKLGDDTFHLFRDEDILGRYED
jgi:chaperonin GroES